MRCLLIYFLQLLFLILLLSVPQAPPLPTTSWRLCSPTFKSFFFPNYLSFFSNCFFASSISSLSVAPNN
ncbi:hypothetical protein M441DRAFT_53958 [Trichoderma asperellum CBS 433.97]|uniref:Secreted protein n=1 Tax=Trichoderma asperellum (strain ATCC 204424 / CBS 433.97 / NBRC 101777) TaxID=1042311 RepID=A0A2T3ZJ80_TRIA4|nr:hypothetical protein M441DRAFT_53958 [Trichoderma asperellum CBS 433.97]PTB44871.1 hypothetical protein M441DRAFT_53958 [Trichoderma asperellum CBS 433.97]